MDVRHLNVRRGSVVASFAIPVRAEHLQPFPFGYAAELPGFVRAEILASWCLIQLDLFRPEEALNAAGHFLAHLANSVGFANVFNSMLKEDPLIEAHIGMIIYRATQLPAEKVVEDQRKKRKLASDYKDHVQDGLSALANMLHSNWLNPTFHSIRNAALPAKFRALQGIQSLPDISIKLPIPYSEENSSYFDIAFPDALPTMSKPEIVLSLRDLAEALDLAVIALSSENSSDPRQTPPGKSKAQGPDIYRIQRLHSFFAETVAGRTELNRKTLNKLKHLHNKITLLMNDAFEMGSMTEPSEADFERLRLITHRGRSNVSNNR